MANGCVGKAEGLYWKHTAWRLRAARSQRLFELFHRVAELRERVFKQISKEWDTHKVSRRPLVVGPRGLCSNVVPIIHVAIAAAKPRHRDKIHLLVLVQYADDRGEFGSDGIIAVILKNGQHGIISSI